MCSVNAVILLLCCTGHSFSSAVQAYFDSRNFCNILRWERASDFDEPVVYSVQYIIYGNVWKVKEDCQNITALSCDLTNETADITERYHGRVIVNGNPLLHTARFYPLKDTIFGAPSVNLFPSLTSLRMTMKLPKGPDNRTSLEHVLRQAYHVNLFFSYRVTLTPIDHGCNDTFSCPLPSHSNTSRDNEVTVNELKPGTEYSGSATYTVSYNNKPKDSEAFFFTFKTHTEPAPSRPIFTASALLGALLVVASLITAFRLYVGRKHRTPNALNLTSGKPLSHMTFSKGGTCISKIEICSATQDIFVDLMSSDPKTRGHEWGNKESYTPQDHAPLIGPWHCHSYCNLQGVPAEHSDSCQSSTQYSMVVGIQHANNGVELFSELDPTTAGCTIPRPALLGHFQARENVDLQDEAQLQMSGSSADPQLGPLFVTTQRGADGLLRMASLFPSTDMLVRIPEVTAFPGDIPLLSDLVKQGQEEWPNFRAGEQQELRTYLPTQIPLNANKLTLLTHIAGPHSDTTSNQSYKQNWIAAKHPPQAAPQETAELDTADSTVWLVERGCRSFLENWEVKIQG